MLDQFNLEIEKRAATERSYIAALVDFCEEKEMDYDEVVQLLHPNIKTKVEEEFIEKNFIPKLKRKNRLDNFFK